MTKRNLLSLLAMAALAGCTVYGGPYTPYDGPAMKPPPPPRTTGPQPCQPVAHVTAIYGDNAYVLHQGRTVQAMVNEPICLGEEFRTGPGTKMIVTLVDGGTLTLDEYTDPDFYQTAECFIMRLFTGRMKVDASGKCVQKSSTQSLLRSTALYEVSPNDGSLRITVIQGHVETMLPPGFTINAGQTMILSDDGKVVAPPRQLSPQEIQRMQSWVPVSVL